ncbi:MAG: aminotransferase class I/II-fold pyridoxal phosphate-dependent enzyme [Saprospiraceae bacterium]|nr:aminotransferase class I/II-fold pyridoxal phosphate-dependent enzyme [Saprospiraceae bacterium]
MIISPARRLDNIQEYYFSKKLKEIAAMRSQGIDVLNLGIGSPDLPPLPEVSKLLGEQSCLPDVHAYQSYVGIPELRNAFADWYGRFFGVKLDPATEVLPLIGSKEGIMHIAMTFLEPGDVALVPNPGYPTYRAASELAGATVVEVPLTAENGWLPDLKALEQTDLSRAKILWVNYPNMPTGAHANPAFFEKLIAFGKRHNILIINDNPYSFILNDDHLSLLSVAGAKDVALELNSLSKSHNLAGWRVGVLAGRADYLSHVVRFKSNMDSGMFKPVQLAAALALGASQDWYDNLNATYNNRRKLACQLLDLLSCEYDPTATGMFVWARVLGQYQSGYELTDLLLNEAHVFITPGGIFGSNGEGYVRISLCSKEEVFEEAIRRISVDGGRSTLDEPSTVGRQPSTVLS